MKVWFHCKKAREYPRIITLRIDQDEAALFVTGLWETHLSLKNSLTPETQKAFPIAYEADSKSLRILETLIYELNLATRGRG